MLKKIAVLVLSLCVTVFSYFMIRPMFLSYDEGDHFVRAYSLTKGVIVLDTPQSLSTGMDVNIDLARFVISNGGAHPLSTKYFIEHEMIETNSFGSYSWAKEGTTFYQMPGTNLYFPAVYMPQSLGIIVGKIISDDIQVSYYLSVLFVFFSSVLMLYWANRYHSINPFIYSVLLTPLFLMQLYSSSIDATTTALSIFVVCLFINMIKNETKSHIREWIFLYVSIFILVTCRTHLVPLVLFSFILAWRQRSVGHFLCSMILVGCILTWVYIASKTTIDLRKSDLVPMGDSILFYIGNPNNFFEKFFNTVTNIDILSNYWHNFIVVIYHGNYLVFPFIIVFFLLAITSFNYKSWRKNYWIPILFVFLALSTSFLIFLALTLGWTPLDSTYILGVQGRYFIVPFILLGFALSGTAESTSINLLSISRKILLVIFFIMMVYFVYANYNKKYSRWFIPYQVMNEWQLDWDEDRII